MRIYIVMCWRNLWRNPRRSLVVVSAIAVGIFSMLISMSLMNGMNEQMVDNIIRTSLGHVAIQEKRYFEDMDLKHSFDYNQIDLKDLEAVEGLKFWAPRLRFEGMVQSSETSQGALLVGIDPLREAGVSSIKDYVLTDEGSQWLDNPQQKRCFCQKPWLSDLISW